MEEEQQENWCQNPHYAKIGKNWHLCQFWPCRKIGIGANFGTMPIFGQFWPCRKIGIGANFGTMPIFGINFGIGEKIGIGANFGIGVVQVWHAGKLALVPILAPTSCEIPSLLLFDFLFFFPLLPSLFNAF